MKIKRSSKCTLRFTTENKKQKLREILQEYSKTVNFFINHFWEKTPTKGELLKPIIDLPNTWLSARLRKVAAREAIDLILSVKNKEEETKPTHSGYSMSVSSTIADLQISKTKEYDCWLHLQSIGRKIIFDLPIKLHKHINKWLEKGQRLNSYIITENNVQFCFEIETGIKKTEGKLIGVDTGINTLAATSDRKLLGKDIKEKIETINKCEHGSNRQKQLRRGLRQRMDEVAKEVVEQPNLRLVVVESLKKMNHKTKIKRRINKKTRKLLGSWNYRYWLNRIQMACELNRVSFRTVNPAYTSQRCPECNHTKQGNRSKEKFCCRSCGYTDNADLVGGRNILDRFLTGPYGAGFKPLLA